MGYYANGLACRNGHWITAHDTISDRAAFCKDCGAAAINKCDHCSAKLKGAWQSDISFGGGPTPLPSFCEVCSKPWPWTDAKLLAMSELVEAEGSLTPYEIETLRELAPHLVVETPRTQAASFKSAAIIGRLGSAGKSAMLEILKSIAVDAAKKTLGI